ncbi:hypothetical protein OAQ99_04695 [Candidatus Kapabacteria bacterium]|nr:hypothetical protein [Candidatus Kapabacteria bacterium]
MEKKINLSINSNVIGKPVKFGNTAYGFENMALTLKELMGLVTVHGYAFCNARIIKNKDDKYVISNSCFGGTQIIAIDIDNQLSKGVKDEDGYIDFETVIEHPLVLKYGGFVYHTPSSTDEWHRLRIVFFLDRELTNIDLFKRIYEYINTQFNGDKSTSKVCQIFYGNKNAQTIWVGQELIVDDLLEMMDKEKAEAVIQQPTSVKHTINDSKADNNSITVDSNADKEAISTMTVELLKNRIDNKDWFTYITGLGNTGMFDQLEIIELITRAGAEVGDAITHIRNCNKYNDIGVGSLFRIAKKYGYQHNSDEVTSSEKFYYFKGSSAHISNEDLNQFCINSGMFIFNDKLHYIDSNIIYTAKHKDKYLKRWLRETVETFDDLSVREKKSIKNAIHNKSDMLARGILDHLPEYENINHLLLKDVEGKSFIAFKNGYVEINADNITFKSYADLNSKYILNSEILDFNLPSDFTDAKYHGGSYELFTQNICKNRDSEGNAEPINELKYNSLMSAMGNLLHTFKDESNPRMVVISDEMKFGNSGGTGKSLLLKGLGNIRAMQKPGKDFNPNDPRRYDMLEEHTRIMNIDDASTKGKHGFDIENMNTEITGDMSIRKLYNDTTSAKFENTPKFCMSTNRSLETFNKHSYERRIHSIELGCYYNKEVKPELEFGFKFYKSWNDDEWYKFFNTAMRYIQYYLKNGWQEYDRANPVMVDFINKYGKQCLEVLQENVAVDTVYSYNTIKEILEEVREDELSPHIFTKMLKLYAKMNDCKFIKKQVQIHKDNIFEITSDMEKDNSSLETGL